MRSYLYKVGDIVRIKKKDRLFVKGMEKCIDATGTITRIIETTDKNKMPVIIYDIKCYENLPAFSHLEESIEIETDINRLTVFSTRG